MYYSAKAFADYVLERRRQNSYNFDYFHDLEERPFTRRALARIHARAMQAVLERQSDGLPNGPSVWKWHRPWHIVPALRDWCAPEGDFGIGIEIELGFASGRAAQDIAEKVQHMRHITLDFEGGSYPIEATFPPTKYSTFGSRSQACRYLKIVEEAGTVVRHHPDHHVGTHINVSKGGRPEPVAVARIQMLNSVLANNRYGPYAYLEGLSTTEQRRYFGRIPYGYVYNMSRYFEFKLFNSVTDWKVLRRYVDISVELVKLLYSSEDISRDTVLAALERGYNTH